MIPESRIGFLKFQRSNFINTYIEKRGLNMGGNIATAFSETILFQILKENCDEEQTIGIYLIYYFYFVVTRGGGR